MINLVIHNLNVALEDKPIIKNFNLTVAPGSVHALMGPNGSGKSTLAYTLMGHPSYTVCSGSMKYKEFDLVQLSPDKRAKLGIFLAFQHPYEIPGVTVRSFLKEACYAIGGAMQSVEEFNTVLQQAMESLGIDASFAYRNLNEGFSGGEKKRLEMLQLLLLKPTLVILDEIDSGLDVDALKVVARGLSLVRAQRPDMSVIIITHYQRVLQEITPDYVHIMYNGAIVHSGDASLAHEIEHKGYDAYCPAQLVA